MKIYLSGPMTGHPDWNYPAFNAKAEELRHQGHTVFNPAEAFNGNTELPFTEYMRHDIIELLSCKAIYMLPGWKQSLGARLEVAVATAIGIDVIGMDLDDCPYYFNVSQVRPLLTWLLGMEQPELKQPETILEEAQRLVHGDRGDDYGHPFDDFSKTAKIWEGLLGCEVSPEQVALCMIGVKMSRQVNKPKRDNVVDMAGYAETLQMVVERRQELGL